VTNSGSLNGTWVYYYDGWEVIEERDGSDTLLARYFHGRRLDERLVMERQDTADVDNDSNTTEFQTFYYHTDSLGNVRACTWYDGSNEKTVEMYDYQDYGAPTITFWGPDRTFGTGDDTNPSSSAIGNPYLFTARRYDPETILYFYRARYMEADTGRFTSHDPAGYDDGMSLYEYCRSNPINLVDPMGLMGCRPPAPPCKGKKKKKKRKPGIYESKPPKYIEKNSRATRIALYQAWCAREASKCRKRCDQECSGRPWQNCRIGCEHALEVCRATAMTGDVDKFSNKPRSGSYCCEGPVVE